MESNNKALTVLRKLKSLMRRAGKVQLETSEACRITGLSEDELRECLSDLECEGYIRTEIVCHIAKEWR